MRRAREEDKNSAKEAVPGGSLSLPTVSAAEGRATISPSKPSIPRTPPPALRPGTFQAGLPRERAAPPPRDAGNPRRSLSGLRSPRSPREPVGAGPGGRKRGRPGAGAAGGHGPTADDTAPAASRPGPRRWLAGRGAGSEEPEVRGPGPRAALSPEAWRGLAPRLSDARASPGGGPGPLDSAPGRGPADYIREPARAVAGVTGLRAEDRGCSVRRSLRAGRPPSFSHTLGPAPGPWRWRSPAPRRHRGAEALSTAGGRRRLFQPRGRDGAGMERKAAGRAGPDPLPWRSRQPRGQRTRPVPAEGPASARGGLLCSPAPLALRRWARGTFLCLAGNRVLLPCPSPSPLQ
ncbi:translation initiation factor IF-2-like [Psammomys obesus]|uniref:translation initiation factor IF-2-like n=1 Tax=Psammomys obesus TaxID=48139 RepID=UPI0024532FDB|nr:translation initiation factor IF-2-like [Psammomys obesus]